MDAIDTKIIENHKYVAVYDPLYDPLDQDFESEQDKLDHLKRFQREELAAYGVIKYEQCKCCECWKEIDSLWGIEAESGSEALEYYIEQEA